MKSLTYLLVFLLCPSSLTQGQESLHTHPNILLIVAEDMGRDINQYREMPFATPGLDSLAERGVVFSNAYAASPTCSSSRASLFTGLFPHANGQIGLVGRGSRLHKGIPTFVDTLSLLGYFTSATYKLHVEPEPRFNSISTVCCTSEKFFEQTFKFIDSANQKRKPWFVMLNLWDTHSIKNKNALAKRNYWSHQINGLPTVPLDAQSIDTPPYLFGHIGKAHPNLAENIAAYYNAIRRVDHNIERVLQELDARALSKNTIIVFTSDHGPAFPRGKQMLYELGVHVPLIVVAPGTKPATRNASLVSLIDLMPTLIEFAGGEVPTLPEARSLAPILRGAGNSRQYVAAEFFQHWGPGDFFPSYTIRDTRYKLIYNSRPKLRRPWAELLGIPWVDALPHITDEIFATAWEHALNPPEFELYDLDIDPWEFNDIAKKPQYAAQLKKLKEALQNWRLRTLDPFLEPEAMDKLVTIHQRSRLKIRDHPLSQSAQLKIMSNELTQLMNAIPSQ